MSIAEWIISLIVIGLGMFLVLCVGVGWGMSYETKQIKEYTDVMLLLMEENTKALDKCMEALNVQGDKEGRSNRSSGQGEEDHDGLQPRR